MDLHFLISDATVQIVVDDDVSNGHLYTRNVVHTDVPYLAQKMPCVLVDPPWKTAVSSTSSGEN